MKKINFSELAQYMDALVVGPYKLEIEIAANPFDGFLVVKAEVCDIAPVVPIGPESFFVPQGCHDTQKPSREEQFPQILNFFARKPKMFESFRRYDEVVRSFGKTGKINGIIMLGGISFFVEDPGKNRRGPAPVVESLCAGSKPLYQGIGHFIEKSHIPFVVR